MVMATGIVSIACQLNSLFVLAHILFWLNLVFYVALWVLTLARCAKFPQSVRADVLHHGRSVGFFTLVAGTCVRVTLPTDVAQSVEPVHRSRESNPPGMVSKPA